ncbi:MAG: hypothetical protein AAF531_17680 [Actinomycetota bacterium]
MTRCVCGSESDEHARFCWSCGRPIGDDRRLGGLAVGETGAMVASTVVDGSVLRTGASDRRGLLAMVGLLAVVALAMLWGTSRGEPTTPAEEQGDEASPRTTTTIGPTTTATTPTTERPITTSTLTIQQIATELEGPFGYDLLISTVGRPARLDLDGGTVSVAEGSRVFPQFVWGSWVVVMSGSGQNIARLPLGDLGAHPELFIDEVGLIHSYVASPISTASQTGQFWIGVYSESSEPNEALYHVDLETGKAEERAADDETYLLANALANGLITARTGGVYQHTADGYRKVTDGRVLLSDTDRALVETCDDDLVCTLRWLDTANWERLDLEVPVDQQRFHQSIPGTDWIFSRDYDVYAGSTSGALLNVVNGEVIMVNVPDASNGSYQSLTPAVSPDGRWLATRGEDTAILELRDLVDGDIVRIELEERIAGPMFFISD